MQTNNFTRQAMIQSQLLTGAVLDPSVLAAMRSVPREEFVPARMKQAAYLDEDIEIATGRYLIEPLTFAKLLVLAEIKPSDKVLDVACGSGYSAAVLARLATKVVALEEIRDIAEKAKDSLKKLAIGNVEVVTSALAQGYAAGAPYDAIIINGAVQMIPDALRDQLGQNGRLVVVENISRTAGSSSGLGKATVYTKIGNEIFHRVAFDASVPLLIPFKYKQDFLL